MQKLNLLTYADELYRPIQKRLVEHAQSLSCFDVIYTRNRSHLVETDFYRYNKYILDKPKGSGLCLWKPHYILDTLNRMAEGDILVYMDAADWIENGETLRAEVLDYMYDKNIVLTAGAFPNRMYTKRDCFVVMGCDSSTYWDAIQIEAGIIVVKNNDYTKKILLEYLSYCKMPACITEDANICGRDNFPEFKEGRYDQQILSLIAVSNNILPVDFMRKFIVCNVNMPV